MSLLDFSPRITLGTFSIVLNKALHEGSTKRPLPLYIVFRFFVLIFNRLKYWSTQLISLSPETTVGIWTKPYGNHCILNVSIFLANLSTNMAALASDCLMYFRLLLWNCCIDFNNIYRQQVLTKCITSPNQSVFLLVQPENYMISLVSYWLTSFQFLRNRCTDYYKMLRKKVQFWINFV